MACLFNFLRLFVHREPTYIKQLNTIVADRDAKEYLYSVRCNIRLWMQFKKKMKKVIVKKLSATDYIQFISLIRLFEDVFEMENFDIPPQSHLENLLATSDFHVFVAMIDNEVIGGLTIYTLKQYYATKPLAYIYDLAVKSNLQRQGIGKQLISFIKVYFKNEGYEEIFVQADRVDDYALDFYRKTSPTNEEDVLHFYYKL